LTTGHERDAGSYTARVRFMNPSAITMMITTPSWGEVVSAFLS
jgi:hypothetical protein